MSDNEYRPDSWVMLKLTCEGEDVYKILAGWSGSYLDGASWKLNSGITKIEEEGQCYLFHGYSGSVYRCHKSSYRLSVHTAGILASFQRKIKEQENVSIEMLPEETNFMEIKYA